MSNFFRLLFIFLIGNSYLPANHETKLCLTMIVKNESKIIERLLDSVKDAVDCISICDTGSDDNTVEIIENYIKIHNIPGKVYSHEWKNFGHNRTLSAEMAKVTIEELGFSLSSTYLLLLDADLVLNLTSEFNKNDLTIDGYLLKQKTSFTSYYNMRLLRASLPWKCIGVTHEYWGCEDSHKLERMETLFIDDKEDGGSKSDKFERDINLLTQGLKDEPDNVRYLFYLAQSYRDIQNYPLALEYYEKRANAGGWDEEIFESLFQIAIIQQHLNMPVEKVAEGFKRAYLSRPTRAEPLYFLSMFYRNNQKFDLAYDIAKIGYSISFPQHDNLFVLTYIYDWGMKLELSVGAYWANHLEESQKLCKELLQQPNLPEHIQQLVSQNLSAANVKMVQQLVASS